MEPNPMMRHILARSFLFGLAMFGVMFVYLDMPPNGGTEVLMLLVVIIGASMLLLPAYEKLSALERRETPAD